MIQQQLAMVADRVAPHAPFAAARLRELSDAVVSGGPDADAWADAGPLRLVDTQAIATRMREASEHDRLHDVIELLRNTLVLVPLVVTWFGIWRAGVGYADLITARPDLGQQPFLLLWQRGFEGRSPTLSMIALVDVVLLGLVIALTLWAYFLSTRHTAVCDREAAGVEETLAQVLADATLALSVRHQRDPGTYVQSFRDVADGLIGALRQEHVRIADEHVRISEIAARRAQEVADLSTATTTLRDAAAEITTGMRAVTVAAQTASGALTAAAGSIDASMGTLAHTEHAFTDALTDTNKQLADLTQQYEALRTEHAAWGDDLKAGLDGMRNAAGSLDGTAHALDLAASRMGTLANDLATSTRTLIADLDAFLGATAQERTAQGDLARAVWQATTSVHATLTETHDTARLLRMLVVDFSDLARLLPAVPELAATVQRLTSDANALHSAVHAVEGAILSPPPGVSP